MIELKLFVSGSLEKEFGILNTSIIQTVNKTIRKSAFIVRNSAIKTLQKGERSGRLYKRGKTRFHRTSAAGEPAKSDSGRLAGSVRINNRFLEADVGSDLIYAPMLEKGTPTIKPRPWLEPSLRSVEQKIQKNIQKVLSTVLSK